MALNAKSASKEEIEAGLALLKKDQDRKERIKRGEIKGYQKYSELSDEQKASRREGSRRRNTRIMLICQKAVEAGITVTDAEVDAYLTR